MLLACSNVRVCSQQVPILDGSEAERKEAGFIVDRLDLFHEALEAMFSCLEQVSIRFVVACVGGSVGVSRSDLSLIAVCAQLFCSACYTCCCFACSPMQVQCSDGVTRWVVFPLACHCGDWPEQCDICGLMRSTQSRKPCNDCEVKQGSLFSPARAPPRTEAGLSEVRTRVDAILAESGLKKDAEALLQEHSMRYMRRQVLCL